MKNDKRLYGIVEGFFSSPLQMWSKKERLTTLQFITQYAKEINTYYYCPKDDPFVTKDWDILYPEKELKDLKMVVDYCIKNNIIFVFGLNPLVLDADAISQEIFKKSIIQKLNQIRSIGVESFSLLFDDIPVAYDVVSNTIDNEKALFEQLIALVNDVYKEVSSKEFWFCGPDYCFNSVNSLNRAIKELSKNIGVIWSGNTVFSNKVTKKDIDRVRKIIGIDKKLIFWLNYPVNDCEQSIGTFNIGAFPEMLNKTYQDFDGIVVNPMRECYANFPFYITVSKFIEKQILYSRSDAWDDALKVLFADDAMSFKAVIDRFSSRNIIDKEAMDIDDFIKSSNRLHEMTDTIQKMKKYDNNDYAKLFLDSITKLLEESQNTMKVIEKILNKNRVTNKEFEKINRFPTDLNKARYLKEIVDIITARINLLPFYYREVFNKKQQFRNYINKYNILYKGRKALNIKKKDERIMLEIIASLISLEMNCYIKFINDNTLNQQQKLKILALRQSINRFTI